MAYRYDTDLAFLGELSNENLGKLFEILVYDPEDNEKRLTETLSISEEYRRYGSDYTQYWRRIAEELQLFGGNSFFNFFRGSSGVLYNEILCDVCDKMKVNYNKNSETTKIEQNLLMTVLEKALDDMTREEQEELAVSIGIKDFGRVNASVLTAAFLKLFNMGGFKSYQITLLVVNAIWKAIFGRGLTLVANTTITRVASILTGPIGWAVTGIWTAIDIAGPAYRVTIPSVLMVILLRQTYLNEDVLADLEIN
ncbi:DUF3944 domain-containing protein [Actinobacillus delphinicola]|uniref:Uncharacterized protein conserved in bacteria n=1 Tax=Actinobacillus delphinicola TaxID=51161 RepID=A0A448TTY6_9PAST|nr:DUF3944 domain-containing protein [Actinobacillus delphinicola]VEJ09457.1 Uncharacterized protein conserved in bacteria [Actinobacillus delphinicola]